LPRHECAVGTEGLGGRGESAARDGTEEIYWFRRFGRHVKTTSSLSVSAAIAALSLIANAARCTAYAATNYTFNSKRIRRLPTSLPYLL
jgi:hypothetical protein